MAGMALGVMRKSINPNPNSRITCTGFDAVSPQTFQRNPPFARGVGDEFDREATPPMHRIVRFTRGFIAAIDGQQAPRQVVRAQAEKVGFARQRVGQHDGGGVRS